MAPVIAVAALVPVSAFADDLPGVKQPKPIVQPRNEPMEADTVGPDGKAGWVKVGDMQVRVGGYIRYDIGFGDLYSKRPASKK